ncbi:phosphatidylglycerol lysyltransferase domain-containing protein [Streptococcus uberis]|uniref:phosphatidylglycerol lysyltransferase domain-containing protein n=1 Tax=Streptococcus uberis TaxID=1349 RepID=UPI001FF30BD8|nr:phosphatidylglycerol lysyltransferase domain-containing protein [Streptococcus uberis]MCK1159535.1 phosphatidylglycerol lysyltransferase domain-containing protein [Streptococcus uberis]MCK1161312.1 phosphatidylglycerol lysyltransferase domain-containing protein [Streptococcus uberis]MCK1165065.1 phosphatidylglycerol lysyltransferase domain-containing protein [Streptococcus uberis]MCK1188467.1 phosphatidylglycerol lysyltransferase domain-containing protein [Streptococcus uberis]MCK1207094.1 
MDVLFIHLIHYAKDETISTFNMGMCPLSNVGKTRFSFFNEKLGHLLYQFGSHIYSFDGLRHYKEKFGTLLYCLPQTMPFSMCDHGLIIGLLSVRIRSRPDKKTSFRKQVFLF